MTPPLRSFDAISRRTKAEWISFQDAFLNRMVPIQNISRSEQSSCKDEEQLQDSTLMYVLYELPFSSFPRLPS